MLPPVTQPATAPPQIVDWLHQHAFAGRLAVSVPGSRSQGGPMGPFPAGVAAVIDHLAEAYGGAGPPARDQWAFLLGGPGNGKSEALKQLLGTLGIEAPPVLKGAAAPRSVDARLRRSGTWAKLVNDASIPRAGTLVGSLAEDLAEAFDAVGSGGGLLFANVNRGILVEESSRFAVGSGGQVADILRWLNAAAAGTHAGDPALSFYDRCEVLWGGRTVVVHAVCLDAVSLFEPQPGGGVSLDFSGGDDPVVARYAPRGGLKLSAGARDGAIASILIADVASASSWEDGRCAQCAAAPLCPFRANAAWLRDPVLKESFLEAGRASEVAANRRMTYRDLLGHLSLAVLGPAEPDWVVGEHPCTWVARNAAEADGRSIVRLARHRIYAAIFPPPNPSAKIWLRRGAGQVGRTSPYLEIIEDFGLGRQGERSVPFAAAMHRLDPSRSLDRWGGVRQSVIEAAEAMHVEAPTAALAPLLPPSAVSEIEHALDRVVAEMVARTADATQALRRRAEQATRWRSVLLLRQVGLALGELSDVDVVDAWLAAQAGALGDDDMGLLFTGLQSLLLPRDGSLRLAPYRARTRSLGTMLPPSTILVLRRANELSVELRAVKDSLQAVLRVNAVGANPGLPIPVDIGLAREAVLLARWSAGFTDLPDNAMARVERVRASLLSRARLGTARMGLHVTDEEGRLFALRGGWGSLTLVPDVGR